MSELHYLHDIPSPYDAHSVPLDTPLTGPPPARFKDSEVLVAQYRTNPAAIAALVPKPLVPISDVVMVQIGRWGDVAGMGANTQEVNVMVQVDNQWCASSVESKQLVDLSKKSFQLTAGVPSYS